MIDKIIYNVERNSELSTSLALISSESLRQLPDYVRKNSLIVVEDTNLGWLVDTLRVQHVNVLGPGQSLCDMVNDKEVLKTVLENLSHSLRVLTFPSSKISVDMFFNGRQFVREHAISIRLAEDVRISKWVESSVITKVMSDMTPWLQKESFKGKISLYGQIQEGEFVVDTIDFGMRFPRCVNLPKSVLSWGTFVRSLSEQYVEEPLVREAYVAEAYVPSRKEVVCRTATTWIGAFSLLEEEGYDTKKLMSELESQIGQLSKEGLEF